MCSHLLGTASLPSTAPPNPALAHCLLPVQQQHFMGVNDDKRYGRALADDASQQQYMRIADLTA